MKEIQISKAIIEQFTSKLLSRLENDVVIAGSGPAGLAAAYYLAKNGVKTTVIERKLAIGGGIWGGAAGFNEIVLENSNILDEIGIPSKKKDGLVIADSVEFATTLCSKAIAAGAVVFNLTDIEDVVVKKNAVCGVVVNSTGIRLAKLHVDPFCISAKVVIDATGHPAELVAMLKARNADFKVTKIGEGFMDVESSEKGVVEKTGEIFKGLYVAGMSVCSSYNLPRMGPIFGGMLESGKKVAQQINAKL
ncbi:MAG: thiazole biosynthesis protein [Sedimentisphaerales bacterium]|nr:thiazole biosynthesis protein [Sedimentisphaerales bacterium]